MNSSKDETRISLHQTWVIPVCLALTVTAFVIGWVMVTKTLANRDMTIEKIRIEVKK